MGGGLLRRRRDLDPVINKYLHLCKTKMGNRVSSSPVVLPLVYGYSVPLPVVELPPQPLVAIEADRHHLAVLQHYHALAGLVLTEKGEILKGKKVTI